jgi:L-serine dehydratase
MNIFDIIGPVMIGPSSSHTAGALKIGRVAWKLFGEKPEKAVVKLHGSFARTYKGHGTDKAIIAGLMGMLPDDVRIRDSLEIAVREKLNFSFETVELTDVHPNSVVIELTGSLGKKLAVLGSSIGGGNILIKQIDNMEVLFNCQNYTLVIPHRDTPGVIASVTGVIGNNRVNIAEMKVYRSKRGGQAIMIIETDETITGDLIKNLEIIPDIFRVTFIEPD